MSHARESSRLAIWLLVISNVLLPVALLTFATGFFPYKPFIQGTNEFNEADLQNRPHAPFNKVVFMVVDALRSDFVYSDNSGFSFVQSLIRSGEAIPFTGHATSPTITMPRVKALTTGSIPSFLDVILNFAESDTTSTLANQDTWPLQLSLQENGKVNMFGDDTWIKLFPNLFSRMDGTTSFFVSDFTEVDNNVTRNVPGELERDDWNGMIMHYLGLDHIGHKAGPNSPNMIPKQKEMDGIVEIIYNSIAKSSHLEKTLLVLCGDHGMNEAGNHGGSAPGETSPALLFISPKLKQISKDIPSPVPQPDDEFQYYTVVEQSDVVPTLAGLLGFPIPLNNLGIFIPALLDFWPSITDKKWLLDKNIEQVMDIVRPAYSSINFDLKPTQESCKKMDSDAQRLHCGYHQAKQYLYNESITVAEIKQIYKFLHQTQSLMSSVSSNYNMPLLIRGVILSIISYLFSLSSLIISLRSSTIPFPSISTLIWLFVVQLAYGAMMFASSFVEEEHHFWYWILTAWITWLYVKNYNTQSKLAPLAAVAILAIGRVVRRWNQTGQKLAGEPDIAKTFLREHSTFLWILALATYVWFLLKSCDWRNDNFSLWPTRVVTNAVTVVAAVAFKIIFTAADAPELLESVPGLEWAQELLAGQELSSLARNVFLGISLSIILLLLSSRKAAHPTDPATTISTLHSLLSLLLATQTRLINIPLLLLFSLQFSCLSSLNLSPAEITLSTFFLQHASYFAYGGSNAISSIDLSNAYNGVTGYSVLAVGVLTFISNWAGPVFWSLGSLPLLFRRRQVFRPSPKTQKGRIFLSHINHLTILVSSSVIFVQIACLLLRTHLFIWTVFSPKYLYMMAWTLGEHLGVNILISAAVLWGFA